VLALPVLALPVLALPVLALPVLASKTYKRVQSCVKANMANARESGNRRHANA